MKKTLCTMLCIILLLALTGCGSSQATMKIKNINESANTFDFVDTATGKTIEYTTLVVNGKTVVDYECMSLSNAASVAFAYEEGQIVREGNTTSLSGADAYTVYAELLYTLKDGVLTVTGTKD